MIAAGDMHSIRNLLDQLSLDENHGRVGRFSSRRHYDLLISRRLTRVIVIIVDAVAVAVSVCVVLSVEVLYIIIHVLLVRRLLMV